MGPVIQPAPDTVGNESSNAAKFRELHTLLNSFTSAEEAAIRQITPLVSIVRLAHGNIGAKGNTTCVWQQSKLNLILPNLPSQCKFIVVKRTSTTTSQVKSTKFKRQKIHRALILLRDTVPEVWGNIQIDETRVNQWPEEGDLCDLNPDMVVLERDEEGNLIDPDADMADDAATAPSVPLDSDGNNEGPAPLQNSVIAEEEFEGALNVVDAATANAAEAPLVAEAIQEAVERIRNPPVEPPPNPDWSHNQTTATFAQSDVFQTDGFANMNKIAYAWARAFPTLFIPTWIEGEGWRIFHDITGWVSPRDKGINFNAWCEYLVWRSDGKIASHPTFSLVLGNHKMKDAIQKQGR